jgi:aryl-alcohol dehydrogenase-like predicted oxidoreductase
MQMGDGGQGLKRDYIVKESENSLRRLQVDCIDLYQSHKDDPETPLEETLAAFDQLIRQGKVRAIGASNYDAKRLAEAIRTSEASGVASYVSLQPEYNLYDRAGFEAELEPLCLKENIGVISYYSLASGFLTGKYRSVDDTSKSVRGGGVAQKYLNARGFRILKALDEIAAAHRVTLAAIALAWLMQRESVTAPIASATSVGQLSELLKAVEVSLSEADVKALDEASAY